MNKYYNNRFLGFVYLLVIILLFVLANFLVKLVWGVKNGCISYEKNNSKI